MYLDRPHLGMLQLVVASFGSACLREHTGLPLIVLAIVFWSGCLLIDLCWYSGAANLPLSADLVVAP